MAVWQYSAIFQGRGDITFISQSRYTIVVNSTRSYRLLTQVINSFIRCLLSRKKQIPNFSRARYTVGELDREEDRW